MPPYRTGTVTVCLQTPSGGRLTVASRQCIHSYITSFLNLDTNTLEAHNKSKQPNAALIWIYDDTQEMEHGSLGHGTWGTFVRFVTDLVEGFRLVPHAGCMCVYLTWHSYLFLTFVFTLSIFPAIITPVGVVMPCQHSYTCTCTEHKQTLTKFNINMTS